VVVRSDLSGFFRFLLSALLRSEERAGRSLSISMKGNPEAKAEARLIPRNFRSYVDQPWLITQAVHTLDSGGYRTGIAAEPVE